LSIYNKIPKWTGGLSTNLVYKNFDFGIYMYTRQDYGSRIGVLTDQAGCVRYNSINVDFWTPQNPTNAYPQPTPTATQDLLVNSDYSFRDLSFVRLKNINFGYTLPESVSRKILSKKVRMYLAVDNPYIWTKRDYVGLDPENCNATSDYRPLTTFLVGINAKF